MGRFLGIAYGVLCYLAFQAAFLYLIGFLANHWVPKGIDDGVATSPSVALLVDLALIVMFGMQHSIMARRTFKLRLARILPPSIERSTYVLATAVVLGAIYVCWMPLPQAVWATESREWRNLIWAAFGAGNLLILCSTFMIDHFDLFGLRQVYFHFRRRLYEPPSFRVAFLYRFVRHPLYLGFFCAFWATPDMTLGHLVFALGMSAYILVGARLEERDLLEAFGTEYASYKSRVPMVLPRPGRSACPFRAAGRHAPLSSQ